MFCVTARFSIYMITSKQNQTIKRVASLKQKKGRELYGQYVVEGVKMISDAITYGAKIVEIFVTEKLQNDFENSPVEVTVVSDAVFKCISDEVTPQGALAVVQIPKSGDISALSRCLLLDRVQDPGNVGTITRLATACGIKHLLLIDSADPYSPKAVRSSMSGIYHVNVIKLSESECISLLHEQNLPLICADMGDNNVFDYKAPNRFCLCVGNEGNGISDNLLTASNTILSIPMEKGIESLNVAVATGVMLYTLINNQRR